MPNFSVSSIAGVSVQDWVDPETDKRPTRINPTSGRPHLRYTGVVNTPITVYLVGDDASVSFAVTAWAAERPALAILPVLSVATTPAAVGFTPLFAGHYVIVIRRDSGGSVILHFDIGTT